MKLKKIASLALAGIMAVSMLTACGEGAGNGNSGSSSENTNTASNFTQTVLAKTSEYTRGILTVNNDENLDKAVAYVCDNSIVNSYQDKMDTIIFNSTYVELLENAKKYLPESDYTWTDMTNWNFDGAAGNDETFVGMYVVGGKMTDEWIANELAKKIDGWVSGMNDDECKYSIKIVKGTCQNDDKVTAYETSTIVGVLVDIDNTTDNH